MTDFKKEFLNDYNFMDNESFNTDKNAEFDFTNEYEQKELMNEIFDYAINNNLMNLDNETICSVFNNGDTLKIEIHNVETDEKNYVYI